MVTVVEKWCCFVVFWFWSPQACRGADGGSGERENSLCWLRRRRRRLKKKKKKFLPFVLSCFSLSLSLSLYRLAHGTRARARTRRFWNSPLRIHARAQEGDRLTAVAAARGRRQESELCVSFVSEKFLCICESGCGSTPPRTSRKRKRYASRLALGAKESARKKGKRKKNRPLALLFTAPRGQRPPRARASRTGPPSRGGRAPAPCPW